ncbi:MAG: MotA/TolQ/ExbB proton channel family protein [Candidatus Eutrophobiaceae bacterium]
MKARIFAVSLILSLFGENTAWADDGIVSIKQLLERVKQSRLDDSKENERREQEFLNESAKQEARIREAMQRMRDLEAESTRLEQQFNENDLLVSDKRTQRDERLGSLKDLFGHLTGAAGDIRSRFRSSITTSQFSDREEFLSQLIRKMNSETELPSLEEIERVWYEMHREMTESGRVVKYKAKVGTQEGREIVRIGLFNLLSNGEYLSYDEDTRSISVLPRQPKGLEESAQNLQNASSGYFPIGIDPTGAIGGAFLKAIINTPTLEERWHQGGHVGYIITGIGVFALLVALWRFVVLSFISIRMGLQMNREELGDNALGRILRVAEEYRGTNPENLQLKLDEAILRETPRIQRGMSLLKIIAMVAPLLGLLGTVTGMIIVFQAITIYGAGDPKAMAGGISSALVTTVLGLIVAIPTLLIHTLLNSKANKLLHILEEWSAGIIAKRAEN